MNDTTTRPRVFAPNPAKREMERLVLVLSPLWMAAVGTVMATRALAGWSEVEHLVFGVALALPFWLLPVLRPLPSERGVPWRERHSTRFNVAIAVITLVQTWIGSNLFFDQMGMEYHFNAHVTLNRTPVFLFFMTVAYFSTYYVLMTIVWRAVTTRLPPLGPTAQLLLRWVLGYAVAFAETWSMSSDLIAEYFHYRDPERALLVGSIGYGLLFVVTLPLFLALDEDAEAPRKPVRDVVWDALALNTVALVVYEVFAYALGKR